jgi:hypothetical protein
LRPKRKLSCVSEQDRQVENGRREATDPATFADEALLSIGQTAPDGSQEGIKDKLQGSYNDGNPHDA